MGKKVVHVEFPSQDTNRFSLFQSDESAPPPSGA